jgi:5-methyltetrahydrofolate--homocysteine methyltransferase
MPVIREDGIAHYDMTPENFAKIVKDCQGMGATLLGGCCGTTPEHIRALRKILR